MPVDENRFPIQILKPVTAHTLPVNTAAANTQSLSSSIVAVYATDNCYFLPSELASNANSASHYLPKFTRVEFSLGYNFGATNEAVSNISFLAATNNCTVYISEMG